MSFPKAWERNAWAKCPECGYVLHTQEEHYCKGMIYHLGLTLYAREEKLEGGTDGNDDDDN